MNRAYPFHPKLIDILYERVSTIRAFNKTRGVLKLLALTLKNIFMNRVADAYLIMTYHVPLDEFDVKGQLTDALGEENYKQVIETDILEKTRILDSKRSAAIWLYSF
jgi:predicted AAA+ superfamily ATPase